MKEMTAEVKAKGAVVGSAKYVEYENLQEALKAKSEEFCLLAINQRVKTSSINAMYADSTREVSPITKAQRRAKEDPAFADLLEKFIKKHGVSE